MPRLWLAIAKNEIRIWSSRFRNHRPLLFLVIGLILITYAFVLVPLIVSSFASLVQPYLASNPVFMFNIISILLLYIFIWCITYPLSTMLQGAQDLGGQLEVLLGTPVKAQDILFGKFLARLPIYLILLFGLGPWLVNIFVPPSIPEQILVYLVLFGLIVMAMWLGTLLTSYIETKVRKSEKSRDLGRAMTFIITITTVILMYGLMWIIMSGFSDPSSPLHTFLQVLPSTWGAIIILNIFGVSNAAFFVSVNVGVFIALLIGITAVSLYFGYKAAGRFYSLEPTEIGTERITREGRIYGIVRRLVHGDFGVQIVSQLKQFSRKMENFSRIGYAIGMGVIITVFQAVINSGSDEGTLGFHGFLSMFGTYLPAMMMAGLLGTWVIIGSKDNLWIYKKAPSGVSCYVKSVYIVNLIYTVPIALIFVGIMTAAFGATLVDVLLSMGLVVIFLLSLMAMAIGLAFIFPTFDERSSKVPILMMSFFGITSGILVGSIFLGFELLTFLGIFAIPLAAVIFVIPLGVVLLLIGIKKLEALE